eukprot:5704970-Pleurochrysis_carterae.AAC.1
MAWPHHHGREMYEAPCTRTRRGRGEGAQQCARARQASAHARARKGGVEGSGGYARTHKRGLRHPVSAGTCVRMRTAQTCLCPECIGSNARTIRRVCTGARTPNQASSSRERSGEETEESKSCAGAADSLGPDAGFPASPLQPGCVLNQRARTAGLRHERWRRERETVGTKREVAWGRASKGLEAEGGESGGPSGAAKGRARVQA